METNAVWFWGILQRLEGLNEHTKHHRKNSPPVGRGLNTWLSVYEVTIMFGEREVIFSENVQVTTAAYLLYDAVLLRSFPTFL